MVFNTGSALLDAIVLAAVSRERKEPMATGSPNRSARPLTYQNLPCIRCFGVCRRMTAWRSTTGRLTAETAGITGSQNRDGCSCSSTKENGQSTPRRFPTS